MKRAQKEATRRPLFGVQFANKVALLYITSYQKRVLSIPEIPQDTKVSPTRCESLALICARTSKKHNQSCCMNRVTPRTTRQPITEDYKVIVSLLTRASLVTRVYIIG